jgi:hypothetical protein
VHHVTARAEGGTHAPEGLALLCGAHHRLLHRGFLLVERSGTALVFRHADGTVYGGALAPEAVEAGAGAFSALRNLGLRDGEAKRALAAGRAHVGVGAGVPDLVRAALRAHRARGDALLPPPVTTVRESSPAYGRGRRRHHRSGSDLETSDPAAVAVGLWATCSASEAWRSQA